MAREQIERDLSDHAADRVRRVLREVCDLVDDPAVKARIALMASSVCIGSGAVYLSAAAAQRGEVLSEKQATLAVMELLRLNVSDGPDAVMNRLHSTQQPTNTGGAGNG